MADEKPRERTTPSVLDPENRLPHAKYENINVTFTASHQDTEVKHTLAPVQPEGVRYKVVKQSAPAVIYEDRSADRKPWQRTHLWLRSSIPCAATLLVYLPPDDLEPLPVTPFVSVNAFGVVHVAGQPDVEADTPSDTLTLIEGENITITNDPESDAVTISAVNCCGHSGDNDGCVDCLSLCEAYYQDWARGDAFVFADDAFEAAPYGASVIDGTYPEIRAASNVAFVTAGGLTTAENALGSDNGTLGVLKLALGRWNGAEGCFDVYFKPTTDLWDLVDAEGAAGTLTVDLGGFTVWPMNHGEPLTEGYTTLRFQAVLKALDPNGAADLIVTRYTYDSATTVGTSDSITTENAFLSLNRRDSINRWQKFELLWRAATVQGNFDAILSDGCVQVFHTNEGFGAGRQEIYSETGIELVLRNPYAVSSGSSVYGGGVHELNGLIFDGFMGRLGEFGIKALPNGALPGSTTTPGSQTIQTPAVTEHANIAVWTGTHGNALADGGYTIAEVIAAGGGSAFGTLAVSGQSNIVADSVNDTLTVVAGTGITLTTNATTDTLTITGTAAGNSFGVIEVSGETDVTAAAPADTVEFIAGSNVSISTSGSTITFDVPASGGTGNVTSANANGSEPGSPTSGDLNFETNGHAVRRYNSGWKPWGPIFPLTEPVDGDFAWVNQGSASVSTSTGGIFLRGPATSGFNVRARVKTAPSTPYTITAALLRSQINFNYQTVGLCFRQTSDGKMHALSIVAATTGTFLDSAKYTSATSYSGVYTTGTPTTNTRAFTAAQGGLIWLRIADNGTNRICSYSHDGENWIQFHSISRTDYLTADQVGFFVNEESNVYEVGAKLLSWEEA